MNRATNWSPQSEITYKDSSWSFYTWCKNNLATPFMVTVICVRMKWALLDMESTTVMTVLYLEDSGSSTTKSIMRASYLASGTGIE